MSIMPPEPDSKTDPTLRGVAKLIAASADPFMQEVGSLVGLIAYLHDDPNACAACHELGGSCAVIDLAHSVAYSWLLRLIEERG